MTKKHKVQVNYYIRHKDVKNGIDHCKIEFIQSPNKRNLIKAIKERANGYKAHTILIFNDEFKVKYMKCRNLWYKA